MRKLNHICREMGIVLSNELIYQCPECQTFAIGYTKPFLNLKKFCQYHIQVNSGIRIFIL